jgi:threonine dehydratase
MAAKLPTIEDVERAAERLKGEAVRTPLLPARDLSQRLGRPVLVKPECLQRTGSFKFRGAFNRISQIGAADGLRGVVAVSSGNHAQGVAAAAALRGLSAKIVMPADAPAAKRDGTRALGAEIIPFERGREDRDVIAAGIVAEEGRVFVPPYDDPFVIAGQGTVGLEIAEDAAALGLDVDAVVVPAGGGGLIAGTGLAIRARLPGAAVYASEPAGFDDHRRSLASGVRESNPAATGSICDALMAARPGELTFALNRIQLSGAFAVTDDEAGAAVAYAFRHLKLVLEPGGAAALAAVLGGQVPAGTGAIIVVLSGGNVDAALFSRLIGAGASEPQPLSA